MRILIVNKFWYYRAGQERVALDEYEWLRAAGHDVACFAPLHPETVRTEWTDYFPEYLELGRGGGLSRGESLKAAVRLFHNAPAKRAFTRLVDDFRPEVVHIHGIHKQLSPSILDVTRCRGIPVVQTLHDCHHVCPADLLFRGDDVVCEPRACGVLDYSNCLRYRCVRESLAPSALSAAETSFQRLRRAYERGVQRFISPSTFLAVRTRAGGWATPIDVIPNAIGLGQACERGDYVLFAGRLDKTKGVETLIEAARVAGLHLVIAGTGPLLDRLEALESPALELRGHLGPHEVSELVAGAAASVVPSLCYENAPMSVLEAMAVGTPVVASDIGGISEQVTHGVDGLLVPPGDARSLADALTRVVHDTELARQLGEAARATVAARFSPAAHLDGLLVAYRAVGA